MMMMMMVLLFQLLAPVAAPPAAAAVRLRGVPPSADHNCLSVLQLMLPYHAVALGLAVLVTYMPSHSCRRQFLMRRELQRIKDARIDQLGAEKERLDYERVRPLRSTPRPLGRGSAAVPPHLLVSCMGGGSSLPSAGLRPQVAARG